MKRETSSVSRPKVSVPAKILFANPNRSESYIVPKLDNPPKDAFEEPVPSSEFKRRKWADPFSPEGGNMMSFNMRSTVPVTPGNGSEFVLGVTTIARSGASYLHNTLRSLIGQLGDYKNVTILVYIGEGGEEQVQEIEAHIRGNFSKEVDSNLIKIISPPKNFYPVWEDELRQSFGDSFHRVKWRSKQNLDQIFVMMYAYHLNPKYYLMLEDDILASNDYLSKIYADTESRKDQNYVMISYCQLGAIGKLIRRELLPSLVTYFRLFWADKPLDWLLLDYMKSRVCNESKGDKDCADRIKEVEIVYKPSLFQHVGITSSLDGKIQKLRDKNFKP